MKRREVTVSVDTLDALLSINAELVQQIDMLNVQIEDQGKALTALQTKLDQYWEVNEGVDYRGLVSRIREDAHNVGEVLRNLDLGTRRQLARFGSRDVASETAVSPSGEGLLPSIRTLLRTLEEWR